MQTPVKSAVGSVYPPTPASILKDLTNVSRRLAPAPENIYQTQKRRSEAPVHTPVHTATSDTNGKPTPVTAILVWLAATPSVRTSIICSYCYCYCCCYTLFTLFTKHTTFLITTGFPLNDK